MDLEKASKNAWVAAFLTLSGGFLDAFTYVGMAACSPIP
jgi:uncharacterized membrane protein YoaK (UPF0700 family)